MPRNIILGATLKPAQDQQVSPSGSYHFSTTPWFKTKDLNAKDCQSISTQCGGHTHSPSNSGELMLSYDSIHEESILLGALNNANQPSQITARNPNVSHIKQRGGLQIIWQQPFKKQLACLHIQQGEAVNALSAGLYQFSPSGYQQIIEGNYALSVDSIFHAELKNQQWQSRINTQHYMCRYDYQLIKVSHDQITHQQHYQRILKYDGTNSSALLKQTHKGDKQFKHSNSYLNNMVVNQINQRFKVSNSSRKVRQFYQQQKGIQHQVSYKNLQREIAFSKQQINLSEITASHYQQIFSRINLWHGELIVKTNVLNRQINNHNSQGDVSLRADAVYF